jgi:hypothetical protein
LAVAPELMHKQSQLETKETKEAQDIVPAQASQRYGKLDDFTDFMLVTKAFLYDVPINQVHTAKPKIPIQASSQFYLDTYHIAFRKGKFLAQVDKAVSDIYKLFLGYGPDTHIIKGGDEFYFASSTIRDFIHGLQDYDLSNEGIVKKSNAQKMTLKGLASIVAIGYFFGESDLHSDNWGVQENENTLLAYKIDCADALNYEVLSTLITKETIDTLREKCSYSAPLSDNDESDEEPENDESEQTHSFFISPFIISSPEFQAELMLMLQKIAETNFDCIREILIRNISSYESCSDEWIRKKWLSLIAKGPEKLCEETGEKLEKCIEELGQMRARCFKDDTRLKPKGNRDVNFFLALLEARQLNLREALGINPIKTLTLLTSFESVRENLNPARTSYRSYPGYK